MTVGPAMILIKDAITRIAEAFGINTEEEEVSSDEGKALTEQLKLNYFETSSPSFENSHEIFEHLAQKVIK